jgi:YbbR domain-containing protein
MSRLGLKLFCLLAAIVIWIIVAAGSTISGVNLRLPLRIRGLPEGATVAGNGLPATVEVRASLSKLRLVAHRHFGLNVGNAFLDLSGLEPGQSATRSVEINNANGALEDAQVIGPQRSYHVRVDEEVTRRLAVTVVTSGQLPDHRMLLSPPRADPDSIVASGPSRLLDDRSHVRTESVDLSRLKESTKQTKKLVSPAAGVVLDRQEVTVHLDVATLGTRTLSNLPIVPLVDADQPQARVSPEVAAAVISGPVDSLRSLVPSRVSVVVPLSGLPVGDHMVSGQVILPEAFHLVELDPPQFRVTIGSERGPAGGTGPGEMREAP